MNCVFIVPQTTNVVLLYAVCINKQKKDALKIERILLE